MSTLGLVAVILLVVVVALFVVLVLVTRRRGPAVDDQQPRTVADLVRLRAEESESSDPAAVRRDEAPVADSPERVVLPAIVPVPSIRRVPTIGRAPRIAPVPPTAAETVVDERGDVGTPSLPAVVAVPAPVVVKPASAPIVPTPVSDTPWGRAARVANGESTFWAKEGDPAPVAEHVAEDAAWAGYSDWAEVDATENNAAESTAAESTAADVDAADVGTAPAEAQPATRPIVAASQEAPDEPQPASAPRTRPLPTPPDPAAARPLTVVPAEPPAPRPLAVVPPPAEPTPPPRPLAVVPALPAEPISPEPDDDGPQPPGPTAATIDEVEDTVDVSTHVTPPAAVPPVGAPSGGPADSGRPSAPSPGVNVPPAAPARPATLAKPAPPLGPVDVVSPPAPDGAVEPLLSAALGRTAMRSRRSPAETAAEQAAADLALLRTFGFAELGARADDEPMVSPAPVVNLNAHTDDGVAQPVRFRVVGRDGASVAAASVTLLDDRGRETATAVADAVGQGELRAPHPGSYVLVSTATDHQPGAMAITVADTPVDADVLLARSAALVGAVFGEEGPIVGARLTLVQDGEIVDTVDSGADGSYRIADLAAGEYGLSVTAADCEPIAVLLDVPDQAELRHDIDLEPSGMPTGAAPSESDDVMSGRA